MDEMNLVTKIKPYFSIIIQEAERLNFDPNLICAFIWQESAGDPRAARFEPTCKYNFKGKKFAEMLHISEATEVNFQNCSWGLMQVMGCKARELEYQEHLPDLRVPEIGILYGCKVIEGLQKRYRMMDDLIAAYNAGSALRRDNKYINNDYVEAVKFKWAKLEKLELFHKLEIVPK